MNIAISDIPLKLDCLGYISVTESTAVSSTTFTQWGPKAIELGEITQNNGHYAVQSHSWSPILVPVPIKMRLSVSD